MSIFRFSWEIIHQGYPTRIPNIISNLFRAGRWSYHTEGKNIFLSFDDGPHPEITPWVLKQLDAANAKAIFFLIGDNVQRYPNIVHDIVAAGHLIGNHTMKHLDAWKVDIKRYEEDILLAKRHICSSYFRPPFGHFTLQHLNLWKKHFHNIIFWTILSGDFDTRIDGKTCAERVLNAVKPGDIIVFHDSEKAWARLKIALPLILKELQSKNYSFTRFHDEVV